MESGYFGWCNKFRKKWLPNSLSAGLQERWGGPQQDWDVDVTTRSLQNSVPTHVAETTGISQVKTKFGNVNPETLRDPKLKM